MTWLCSCGLVNASCNSYCPGKLTWKTIEHIQITPSTYDETLYWVAEGRVNKILMTPNEELHAKFFREEAILVLNMTDVDLDEHIHELETIAREAKARITAASEEKRNRAAKQGNKKWKVEPLGPDPTVTDSLNKVKQRSQRMSKLDGMRNKLAVLGIPESEIEQMLSKMVALARKEPEALKAESKMRKDLDSAPLVTEEEKLARLEAKRALDKADELAEKQEKAKAEAEKKAREEAQKEQTQAPVHNDKNEKLILTVDEPDKQDKLAKSTVKPNGDVDISKLKFT